MPFPLGYAFLHLVESLYHYIVLQEEPWEIDQSCRFIA